MGHFWVKMILLSLLLPTTQDLRCFFIFLVVSALSFLFSYFFIMDHYTDPKIDRMQASILIYGSTQSLIGFFGGFHIAKTLYLVAVTRGYHNNEYSFVKSDEDLLELNS